ncbi:MAG: DsbA family protein [Kiloniellales bacterium]
MTARLRTALVALLAGVFLGLTPAHGADDLTAQQKQQLEKLVRELLITKPEIVIEALEVYQRRQQAAKELRTRQALAANWEEVHRNPDSPVAGNPKGDVSLVEFFDYQCGYCKSVVDRVADTVARDQNIRWVFKEFPILGPVSVYAARAALAAHSQGKYQEFHLALMRSRGRLVESKVMRIAANTGLDLERLRQDMDAPEITAMLQQNLRLAKALGVNGTPAFVIGDVLIPGAIDAATLQQLIANARGS